MNVMKTLGFLLASLPSSMALVTKHGGYRPQQTRVFGRQQTENFAVQSDDNNFLTRRRWMEELVTTGSVAAAAVIASTSLLPLPAFADVSDGTSLPQGAQQFSRVVRLKTDIIAVKKRLTDGADEIDKKEWDNISKFLRNIYSTAENDIKFVAKGIYNPDNKTRALAAAEQLKKYAQAGDVSASKQDAASLASILDKCSGLVDEFLDSLSDVPDEL